MIMYPGTTAAEIYAYSVAIMVKLEAMKVANQERLDKGQAQAYLEQSFNNLLELHHKNIDPLMADLDNADLDATPSPINHIPVT